MFRSVVVGSVTSLCETASAIYDPVYLVRFVD